MISLALSSALARASSSMSRYCRANSCWIPSSARRISSDWASSMLRLEISSSRCDCCSLRSSRSFSISVARSSLVVRSRSRRSRLPARLSRFSSRFERRRSTCCTSRRRSRSSSSASLILDSPLDTVRLASSRASWIRRRSSERASSTTFEASFFAVSMRLPETLFQTKKKPSAPKPTPNRPDRTASRTTIGASMRSPPYQFGHLAWLGSVVSWYVRRSILSSGLRVYTRPSAASRRRSWAMRRWGSGPWSQRCEYDRTGIDVG